MTSGAPTHTRDGVRDIGSVDTAYVPRHSVRARINGEERVLYTPLPRQDELHACRAPNVLFGGAAGGSKSHGLRWHAVRACLKRPGLKVLLLRRLFKELETTHLLEIEREVPPEIARYHKTLQRLTVPHPREAGGNSILQFGHCQFEKDINAYLSTAWDIILVDEASEFTPRMLSMLQSRLRTTLRGVRPQLVLGTNPGGDAHLWILSRFIDKDVDPAEDAAYTPADYHFIVAKVGDNPYNDANYLTRLLSLPEALREAYLYGNWHAFAGQYFREWRPSEHVLEVTALDDQGRIPGVEEWHEVVGGMDWGYDPHPGVVLWAAFDAYGRPLLYQELTFSLSSPREVAEMIAARCTTEAEKTMIIYGDTQMWQKSPQHAGVSIADEINTRFSEVGVGIVLVQANKDRINGWIRVHSFLDPRRPSPEGGHAPFLRIASAAPDLAGAATPIGCPMLIKTLPAQRHDDKQNGDMKKSENDHHVDALRYLLMAREPLSAIPRDRLPHPSHEQRVRAHTTHLLERAARVRREQMSAALAVREVSDEVLGLPVDGADDDESMMALAGDVTLDLGADDDTGPLWE